MLGLLLATCVGAIVASIQAAEGAKGKTDELIDVVYTSYFPLRFAMSEEMWATLEDQVQSAAQSQPNDMRLRLIAMFVQGERARIHKDLDTAAASFQEATKVDSSIVLPWLGLAEVELDRGDTNKAMSSLFAAQLLIAKSAPLNFQHLCLMRVGDLYAKAGRHTDAIEAYKAAVAKKPNWAQGRNTLAQAYLFANQPAQALAHLQEAIKLRPKDAENYYLLGQARSKLGYSTLAVESLRKAIDLDPGNALYHFDLGLEYEGKRERVAASRSYSTALRIAEKDARFAKLLPLAREALARLEK